ncbi:hypothetical protein DL770_005451 [Monosporascus sp. CRB-9-2]|nr:hypothetical protein DL770_005451 [Monosporascus sp. CRB-9-2]
MSIERPPSGPHVTGFSEPPPHHHLGFAAYEINNVASTTSAGSRFWAAGVKSHLLRGLKTELESDESG